jgi:hypothetical protein
MSLKDGRHNNKAGYAHFRTSSWGMYVGIFDHCDRLYDYCQVLVYAKHNQRWLPENPNTRLSLSATAFSNFEVIPIPSFRLLWCDEASSHPCQPDSTATNPEQSRQFLRHESATRHLPITEQQRTCE